MDDPLTVKKQMNNNLILDFLIFDFWDGESLQCVTTLAFYLGGRIPKSTIHHV